MHLHFTFTYDSTHNTQPEPGFKSGPGNVCRVLEWKPVLAAGKLWPSVKRVRQAILCPPHSPPFLPAAVTDCPGIGWAWQGEQSPITSVSPNSSPKSPLFYKSPFLWLPIKTPDSTTINLILAFEVTNKNNS